MTEREMTELFSVMMLAWPNAEMFKGGARKLGPTIKLWTMCLADVDFWTGQQAVVQTCKTCKFPPSIAEVRKAADDVTRREKTEMENAFLALRNEILLCDGNLDEAYKGLPSKTRRVIDEMGGMERFAPPGAESYNTDDFYAVYKRMLRRSAKGLPIPSGE